MGEIDEYEELQSGLQIVKKYLINDDENTNRDYLIRVIDWFAEKDKYRILTGQLYFII